MDAANGLSLALGKYQKRVDARLKLMQANNFVPRLWNKESALFGSEKITSELPMGWLELPDKMLQVLPSINNFCKEIKSEGFDHVVLLGMGGSSLAPMVLQKTFGSSDAGINLTVLDTTEPETIKKIERSITLATTLFIVASKSGTTAEVLAFYEYFYYRVTAVKREKAGENFIAITDEGSPLVQFAAKKKFRKVFINFTDVGGRFSALSYFGIVPAALMGINVKEILLRAKAMAISCGPLVPANENTGVLLGTAIAEMALKGCDKLTYVMPEGLESFGLWMEQLIAESTGKQGKGILPFNGLPLNKTGTYGKDRFFVKIGFMGEQNDNQSVLPTDLISVKYPVINIVLKDELDLGREFFRWEIATATAGAIFGIDPFDQPNVQESKKYTDKLLKRVEEEGELPKMEPCLVENSVEYFCAQPKKNAKLILESLLQDAEPGDFVAFQAYLPEETRVNQSLTEMQKTIQKNLKLPVSVQFGPRYLHSTGQYHKGGPNNGYYIQLVCRSKVDIHIPEHTYTFGMLKRAQAIGDREALLKHKRRVVLIDLGDDYISGLNSVKSVIDALQPSSGLIRKSPEAIKVKKSEKVHKVPEAVVLLQNPTTGKSKKK